VHLRRCSSGHTITFQLTVSLQQQQQRSLSALPILVDTDHGPCSLKRWNLSVIPRLNNDWQPCSSLRFLCKYILMGGSPIQPCISNSHYISLIPPENIWDITFIRLRPLRYEFFPLHVTVPFDAIQSRYKWRCQTRSSGEKLITYCPTIRARMS
jgi:hypothetical protein